MSSVRQRTSSIRKQSLRAFQKTERASETEEIEQRAQVSFMRADLEVWKAQFDRIAGPKGYVDLLEFQMLCEAAERAGGPHRDNQWIIKKFKEADINGDKRLDFREYVAVQYSHRASVQAIVDTHDYEPNPKDVRYADIASRNVQSVSILRETLEKLRRMSPREDVRTEAERLLFHLGSAGLPGKILDEHSNTVMDVLTKGQRAEMESSGRGGRRTYAAMADLAAQMAVNMVDASQIEAQIQSQQEEEAFASGAVAPERTTIWTDLFASLPHGHDMDQILSFFQYSSLTLRLAEQFEAQWPSFNLPYELPPVFTTWQLYLGWMNLFNLDLSRIALWAQKFDLPAFLLDFADLPFSSLYLLVTAVVPLSLSFIILLMEYPLYRVVWIFVVCFSVVSIISVSIAQTNIDQARLQVIAGGSVSPVLLNVFLYTSIAVLALCLIAYAVNQWYHTWRQLRTKEERLGRLEGRIEKMAKEGKEDVMALAQFVKEGRKKASGFPPPYPLGTYARNLFLIVAAVALTLVDSFTTAVQFDLVFEIAVGAFAGFMFTGFALSLTGHGRLWLERLKRLFDKWAVSVFLLLLSILYMPITRLLLVVWVPVERTCAAGQWIPEYASNLEASSSQFLSQGSSRCEPCDFISPGYSTPWSGVQYNTEGKCDATFCPAETSVRSFEDPRLDYQDEVLPFFGPASIATLLGFTVGVPVLYGVIVHLHTKQLEKDINVHASRGLVQSVHNMFTVIRQRDLYWDYRVGQSENRAKSLYAIFEYRFRFMKVFIMAQKLVLITMVIYLTDYLLIASLVVSVIHFAIFFLNVVLRPFFDPKSNALAWAISFASAVNPLIIVLTYYGVTQVVPAEIVALIIIALNFVFPLLALCLGCAFSMRRRRALNKAGDKIDELLTEAERLTMAKERKELDRRLDEITLRWVLRVFVVMTVTGFISIAFLAFGQFWQAAKSNVVAPTPSDLGSSFGEFYATCQLERLVVSNELVGYGNWRNFTRHCCCMDRRSEVSYGEDYVANEVELWACDNGFYKERDRTNALFIREFCSPVFDPKYSEPEYDPGTSQVVVRRLGPDPDARALPGRNADGQLPPPEEDEDGAVGEIFITGW